MNVFNVTGILALILVSFIMFFVITAPRETTTFQAIPMTADAAIISYHMNSHPNQIYIDYIPGKNGQGILCVREKK
jgi:hypothetical protein